MTITGALVSFRFDLIPRPHSISLEYEFNYISSPGRRTPTLWAVARRYSRSLCVDCKCLFFGSNKCSPTMLAVVLISGLRCMAVCRGQTKLLPNVIFYFPCNLAAEQGSSSYRFIGLHITSRHLLHTWIGNSKLIWAGGFRLSLDVSTVVSHLPITGAVPSRLP